MTDKLSQVTEDDVLSSVDDPEHTLGGITEDDTGNQTQTAGGTPVKKKGSGNSKTIVIVLGITTIVAVSLAVAYFSFVKKETAPRAKNVVKKEAPKVKEEAPVKLEPQADSGFPSDSKESKTAADFLTRDVAPPIPLLEEVVVERVAPVAPVVPVTPMASVTPPVVPVSPVVAPELVTLAPAQVPLSLEQSPVNQMIVNPVEAPAVVADTSFNSAFDSVATRVDAVSTRVDGLERFKSAQEDLNNQFEKRIERLEGFHEDGKGCNCDDANKGTVAPVKKVQSKPATVKKTAAASSVKPKPRPKPARNANIDGDLLVDKSSAKAIARANKPAPLEEYQFHSIYDNRVWWRKADGSLDTATVGSKLPSGEVIKEVNHDKFEVVTNKRTIRKR